MDSVSNYDENGLRSEYYKIDHKLSKDNSNAFLNITFETFLSYLAIADVFKSDDSKVLCVYTFDQLLNYCKTEEEKYNLKMAIYDVAALGGYATEFLKEVQPKLANIVEINKEEEQKYVNNGPVTKIIPNGIYSPYFDIEIRPSKDKSNFNLNLQSSSLLFNLATIDLNNDKANKYKLDRQFYMALSKCNKKEEFEGLDEFIKEAASLGGYAAEYYYEIKSKINEQGKEEAIKFLNEEEEKRKLLQEKKRQILEEVRNNSKKKENIEEDDKKLYASAVTATYNALHNRIVKIYNSPTKDSDEVEQLLSDYKKNREGLYNHNQKFDRGFFEDIVEKFDKDIKYLNKLNDLFEEEQRMWRSF